MRCHSFTSLVQSSTIAALAAILLGCGQGDGPAPVTAEPCPTPGAVGFDSDRYPESATSATVLVSDECIGASKTVIVNVTNGADTIGIDVDVVAGEGDSTLNFGDTNDTSNTIAIKDGDKLEVTYVDAKGVLQSGTADITVVSGDTTTIDADPADVEANGASTSTITVQAKDSSGNDFTVSSGVVLLSTTGSATLSAVTDNQDGTYTATVTNTVAEAVTISGSIAGIAIVDTAIVTFTASTTPVKLGVYSETNIDPKLDYSEIVAEDAPTDRFSQTVSPLEGVYSLQADFAVPASGSENGFAFTFFGLINPTFEANDAFDGAVECTPNNCDGWTAFEFVNTKANVDQFNNFGPVSHDAGGSQSLQMFGPFDFDSASGAYQADNNVVAGQSYTATVYVMNWAPDALAAGNLGIMQLTFWDAAGGQAGGGAQIGPAFERFVDSIDDGTNTYLPPQDGAEISDWTELTITETAPAGTVSAEIFLLHIQLNDPSDPAAQEGSIFWDDVSLTGIKDLSAVGEDISAYETLKFGINTTAASGLADLEVKMEDNSGATASVFLSNYTATSGAVVGWDLYEIPLSDFTGVDKTRMISLEFNNASSTVTGSTAIDPTLFAATLYFDDVHFERPGTAPPALTGVLVNSPIEGVTFQTATQSGITNADGEFQYLDGEMVTFSIGGIVLGTVQGAAIITPVELTGGVDPVDQTAINQLVFLQSIDADADYSTGITISAATQAAAVSQTLDFTLSSADFTTAVTLVVDAIAPGNTVVSETTALDNFYTTYVDLGGTDTFDWSFPPQYPPFPPVVSGENTTIDAVPASVVADGVATSTITVQAKDTTGTDFTQSAGVVVLSTTGSATLSAVTDNDDGTYTATVTNTVAESVTISGSIDGNDIADTAIVTFTTSTVPETLGVYSETNTPVLNSVIVNAADLGGNSTIPDEFSTTVTALDGVVSLEADFQDDGQNTGGIIFDFSQVTPGGGNLLNNGGFGSPEASAGDVLCHTDWTCVNSSFTTAADGPGFAPVSHNPEDNQSIKQFDNDSLTFQVVAATPGTTYQASVWAMNWTGNGTTDPFTEFGFVELSFLDAGGNPIPGSQQYVFVDAVDDGTNVYLPPQDGADVSDWTELTITAVAPAGTASVKMLLIHQLVGGSGGTLRWDDASITAVVPSGGLLSNGGFGSPEASAGDVLCHTDWTCVNSSYTTAADGPGFAPVSHNPEDNQSIKQFDNDSLTFQVVPATPGTTYQASVWAMNWTGNGTTDPFTEFGFVELSFLDAGGNAIPGSQQYVFVDAVDDGTNVYLPPQDGADVSDWTELTITAVAPAGTASVKMLLIHQLVGGSGGTLRWDDASITPAGSVVSGVDLSDYETLKFGIDSSQMAGFADLKLQLEDGAASPSVLLSDYIATPNQGPGANWDVYEIPLDDFNATPQLNLANIVYLGFRDAQDAGGSLTFGPLYFDDIHFVKAIPTVPVLTGVLLDSPVEGVTYQTATQSGVTNALGEFQYLEGEMVTFSIGDIILGTVEGAPIITPVELTGSFDPTYQAAINQLVFLQSIDEDEFHANGITISAATQAAAVGQTLDFNLSSTDFTTAVTSVVAAIAPGNTVVSETTALDSFYLTYVQLGGTDTFLWLFPGYPQIGEPGYDLIWTDEFNTGTAPSATNWLLETGYGPNNDGWGNNEWQLYTDSPDNVKLENGNLVITADCPTAPTCGVRDGTITSARINTLGSFSFKYGKIVARIKPPVGKGAWPAFWMLGANFPDIGWPFSGEIDVMEMHNAFSDEFTTHFTMHWCDETAQDPATPEICFPESEGWTYISQFRSFADSLGDDFHVFSAEWDANGIVGKIDGIEYFSLAIDPGTMDEFLKEFFVLLNVAMGGTLGSNNLPPDGTETWPQIMRVDYVRVYQLIGGDGTYTIGGGTTPSDNTLGVYSETSTNPTLPYVQIIDAAEFGGNSTDPNEFSTAVIPLDGSVALQALFLDSGADFGGIIFNFGSAVYPPDPGPGDGQDISNYTTLKFGINAANVPGFADLKVQLEDGDGTIPGPSVFLSSYTATPSTNNWMIYEIPLNDFVVQGLDKTNLTYLGFWNASSVVAAETPLVFGPLYFDDIHFISGTPASGPNLLTNHGFESPDAINGDIYCSTDWTCFNAGNFTNNTSGPSFGPVSHDTPGTQSLKQYGADAGAYQEVAVTPGVTYNASAWAMNWQGDPLNNLGILQLTFRDAGGNQIGPPFENFVDSVDDGTNIYLPVQDGADISDWTRVTVSGTAPAGAVSARLLLLHVLTPPAPASGTIRWDDASIFEATP